MGASPPFKVYTADGEYVAACVYPEDAAALVNCHGDGATIRLGHSKKQTVWTEGKEAQQTRFIIITGSLVPTQSVGTPAGRSSVQIHDTERRSHRNGALEKIATGLRCASLLE